MSFRNPCLTVRGVRHGEGPQCEEHRGRGQGAEVRQIETKNEECDGAAVSEIPILDSRKDPVRDLVPDDGNETEDYPNDGSRERL